MALFVGNDTHHGTHGDPSPDPNGGTKWVIRPTAKTIKTGPSQKDWEDHISGKRPLGVVPITNENKASWGSIDHDVYDEDLTAVIAKIEKAKLPLVPCRSKSGGLHLFMFATEPVDARRMQDALREMAASLGLGGSEIFPKQATLLADRRDQGSWMIMPYFGGDYGGKLQMQHGLKKNGAEQTLNEFVRFAEKMRQSPDEIELLTIQSVAAPKKGKSKKAPRKGVADDDTVEFGDGPPCLVHLTANGGVPSGGQNSALFHMGVYYKKKYPDDWQKHLEIANHKFLAPPGSTAGLDSVVKSLGRRDYQYKCKDQPMASHCDAILCRRKRFGVGGGGVAPVITSMQKLDSDPPVWFIDVEGAKIECGTEDLQRWDRFQRHLMNKLNNPFGVIPQAAWFAIVQDAMSKMTETIEVSPDSGFKGQFLELVETYLTNRQRGQKKEDLLSGRPWEDEDTGRHYFKLQNLEKFLKREGMRDITRGQIVSRIIELEGGHAYFKVKGLGRNFHWIPSSKLLETPEIDPPETHGSPI
jgi:hypothetical protein